ncbi:hypothetical protein [Azotobacter beijerinckii]|nr:hypothetical protein [Azotobacter beijerinckii]
MYRYESGAPNGVFGAFTYQGNGVSCTSSEAPQTAPSPAAPTSDTSSQCTEKVTNADGSIGYTCQSSEVFKNPGAFTCGTVDTGSGAEFTCVAKTPSPKLVDKQVTTQVTEKTNADGSKDTTTTTTTTKTSCSGVDSCSPTTTTNVSNDSTKADGSAGDTTSTCTGSGCSTPESEAEEEQEDEEGPTVSGDGVCTATPACSGDAIQCAILRQTHDARCKDEEFRNLDDAQSKIQTALNSEFGGSDYQPLTATAGNTHTLDGMLDTSTRFSKSCPMLPVVSYTWVGGAPGALDLNVAGLCTYLEWMGYLMVAFAMRGGAEIIARGFV